MSSIPTKLSPPDPVHVLRGSKLPISYITFLEGNDNIVDQLAAGTRDGEILIWDLELKDIEMKWKAYSSSILWLQGSSNKKLWSQGRSDSVILWSFQSPVPSILLKISNIEYIGFCHCSLVETAFISYISVPGPKCEDVSIYNPNSGQKIKTICVLASKKCGILISCAWSIEIVQLITMYESGDVILWDTKYWEILSEIKVSSTPICLGFSQIVAKGIIGTSSEKVFAFSLTDSQLNIDQEFNVTNDGLSSCVWRPDGKIYATGGWDYRIRIFSSKRNKPLAVMMYHKETVECVTFSSKSVKGFPPGFMLAASSSDKSISLWNVYN